MNNPPIILLDAGHGCNTPGKQSPDGRLREYAYARDMVGRIDRRLRAEGVRTFIVTPEPTDTPLAVRVQRANAAYHANADCGFLVSVHCNAAGAGGWMAARGWSVHVDTAASLRSKRIAGLFFDAAQGHGLKVRRLTASEKFITQPLYICGRRAAFPAVLTENLFQDNREDVSFLLSEVGRRTIVDVHVEAALQAIALF